ETPGSFVLTVHDPPVDAVAPKPAEDEPDEPTNDRQVLQRLDDLPGISLEKPRDVKAIGREQQEEDERDAAERRQRTKKDRDAAAELRDRRDDGEDVRDQIAELDELRRGLADALDVLEPGVKEDARERDTDDEKTERMTSAHRRENTR